MDFGHAVDLNDALFKLARSFIVGTAPGAALASIPIHSFLPCHRMRATLVRRGP
jgi:hypothetical protein